MNVYCTSAVEADNNREMPRISLDEGHAQTEDDGDDELLTNDEDENATLDRRSRDDRSNVQEEDVEQRRDYFHTPTTPRFGASLLSSSAASRRKLDPAPTSSPPKSRTPRRVHNRNLSTTTILFNPVSQSAQPAKSSSSTSPPKQSSRTPTSARPTPAGTGTHTPTRRGVPPARPRPILPSRAQFQSAPNRIALHSSQPFRPFDSGTISPRRQIRHRRSSLEMDITSDMGLPDPHLGAVPSSFATQMAMATGMVQRGAGAGVGDDRMGRLVLARMRTLEEGLEEVVRGFRDMKRAGVGVSVGNSLRNSTANSLEGSGDEVKVSGKGKGKKPLRRRTKETVRPSSAGIFEEKTPEKAKAPEEEVIEGFTKRGSSF